MESLLGENLRFLRKQKGIIIADMADLMGFTEGQLTMWELGNSFPKFLDFLKISEFFKISETDLVHTELSKGEHSTKRESPKKHAFSEQKGEYLGEDKGEDSPKKTPVSDKTEVMETLRKIEADVKENFGKTGPYNVYDFDGHAAAGQAIALLENDKKRGEPNMYLPGLGPGLHIRISAAGESMFPSIKPGDKPVATWVSKLSEVHPGGVYIVIDANDGAVCKRLYKEGKTHFRLESDNEMFQPYKRHLEDVLAVFRVREVHSTDLRPYMLDVRRDIRVLQTQMEEMQTFLHQK